MYRLTSPSVTALVASSRQNRVIPSGSQEASTEFVNTYWGPRSARASRSTCSIHQSRSSPARVASMGTVRKPRSDFGGPSRMRFAGLVRRRQAQCRAVQAAHVSRQPRPQHLLQFEPGAAKRAWGKSSWSNLKRQHKIARSLTKQSRTRTGDSAGYPFELSYQQLRTASFGLHGRQQ